ncbi:hypothetical protein [Burkholderia lata]|uniref:hypothetical protein n=1 Tax=Burkholderia lata (strain ATCC 17760 / DSM 23089 / LMG 22485 / NCIMB 9086 / R18194 / 383) TaxID=482957 RepID=UPI0015823DBB|nr:hypothetical protein [Burkholderia lata]
MKKFSAKKIIIFLLWAVLALWVISRTPTGSVTKERLGVMVVDMGYLFGNSTILSRHENAKSGAALAVYDVDASTFSDKKSIALKESLKERGWTFAGEGDGVYVMCKSGMKFSISSVPNKEVVNGLERRTFSVSMEFNAGTEDFCRRRMH